MTTKATTKKLGRPARTKESLFAEIQRLKAQVKEKDSTVTHLRNCLNVEHDIRRRFEQDVNGASLLARIKYVFTKEV